MLFFILSICSFIFASAASFAFFIILSLVTFIFPCASSIWVVNSDFNVLLISGLNSISSIFFINFLSSAFISLSSSPSISKSSSPSISKLLDSNSFNNSVFVSSIFASAAAFASSASAFALFAVSAAASAAASALFVMPSSFMI